MIITSLKKSVVLRCAVLGLLASLYGLPAWAEPVVIVNPGSGISSLSGHQVKELFLGKVTKLPNGTKAVVAEHNEGTALRRVFASKVLGKSESQLKAYWSKLIFSGKGVPPKTLDSSAAVKAFVARTPGAIGYIDSDQADGSVKVVYRVR